MEFAAHSHYRITIPCWRFKLTMMWFEYSEEPAMDDAACCKPKTPHPKIKK